MTRREDPKDDDDDDECELRARNVRFIRLHSWPAGQVKTCNGLPRETETSPEVFISINTSAGLSAKLPSAAYLAAQVTLAGLAERNNGRFAKSNNLKQIIVAHRLSSWPGLAGETQGGHIVPCYVIFVVISAAGDVEAVEDGRHFDSFFGFLCASRDYPQR